MTKDEWIKRLKRITIKAGTYKEFFDDAIEQLASILEIRDAAMEQYQEKGGKPVVDYTNKGGHTNPRKNPALAVVNEENQLALAYWRDLGLTPSGYKKLNGEGIEKKGGSFDAVIQEALK